MRDRACILIKELAYIAKYNQVKRITEDLNIQKKKKTTTAIKFIISNYNQTTTAIKLITKKL